VPIEYIKSICNGTEEEQAESNFRLKRILSDLVWVFEHGSQDTMKTMPGFKLLLAGREVLLLNPEFLKHEIRNKVFYEIDRVCELVALVSMISIITEDEVIRSEDSPVAF
jgi:hypothetical protein